MQFTLALKMFVDSHSDISLFRVSVHPNKNTLFYLMNPDNPLIGLRISSDIEISCLVPWNYFEDSQPVVSVNQIHVNGFDPHHFPIDGVLLHTTFILQTIQAPTVTLGQLLNIIKEPN